MLGHLPTYASAWPAQYARHRAEEEGEPVALVRLASGTLLVDIVGARLDPATAPEGSWGDAVQRALDLASTVLLRVDEPAEAELASMPSLAALRLLTGADDAAIVACYRKLKGLAVSAEETGGPLPPVSLAIMGAPRERALAAQERISRAARAFLEADLPGPAIIERIAPAQTLSLFRGPAEVGVMEMVEALRRREPGGADTAPDEPTRAGPGPRPGPPSPAAVAAAAEVRPSGYAVPEAGHSLAGLIGLVTLETRCPAAERVELATDRDGRLHLIAARLAAYPLLSVEAPERDLLAAAAWVGVNASLVRRIEPGLRELCGPTLHLVTDRRDEARALLGTSIRAHLATTARAHSTGLVAVSLDA